MMMIMMKEREKGGCGKFVGSLELSHNNIQVLYRPCS